MSLASQIFGNTNKSDFNRQYEHKNDHIGVLKLEPKKFIPEEACKQIIDKNSSTRKVRKFVIDWLKKIEDERNIAEKEYLFN